MKDQNPQATKLFAWAFALALAIIVLSGALWVAAKVLGLK